jgi:tryptophan 2,3-dioxygenase
VTEIDYGSYLKIPELLSLQQLQSDNEHDEMLFIVVHQVHELWFKQLLHEFDRIGELIDQDDLGRAGGQLHRVLKILKTIVQQVDVLETMTPLDFESFRAFLGSASGFQSVQFRELEFILGRKDPDTLARFDGHPDQHRLRGRLEQPSVWDRFVALLNRRGHDVRPGDATGLTVEDRAVQDVLVDAYRSDTDLAVFCERLIDVDEGIHEWRYRHVMMVQRTIGMKQGTGGSSGAEYLRSSLFSPFFPDLWAIRARF